MENLITSVSITKYFEDEKKKSKRAGREERL